MKKVSEKDRIQREADERRKEIEENKKKNSPENRLPPKEIDYSDFTKRKIVDQCRQIRKDAKKGYDMDILCRLYGIDYEHPAFTGIKDGYGTMKYYYDEGAFEKIKVAQNKWNELIEAGNIEALKITLGAANPKKFSPRLAEQRAMHKEGIPDRDVVYIVNDKYADDDEEDKSTITTKTKKEDNHA